MRLFSFYPQASDVGETQGLVPATVSDCWPILSNKIIKQHGNLSAMAGLIW
jgi:hypothetical protein